MIKRIVYLHGFLSSPNSHKGKIVKKFAEKNNLELLFFDLYPTETDFTNTTIEMQVNRLTEFLTRKALEDYLLIGSSFGGLISLETLCRNQDNKFFKFPEVLLLLAPALWFIDCPLPFLQPEKVEKWKQKGVLYFDHPKFDKKLPLKYDFYLSLKNTIAEKTPLNLPVYIVHGVNDDTVPITHSINYLKINENAKLIKVEDNHRLLNSEEKILQILEKLVFENKPQ